MDRVESLKNDGNGLFSSGRTADAISKYREGIHVWSQATEGSAALTSEAVKLGTVLYSNLANAYLTMEAFDESAEAALAASRVDPGAYKPYLRFVEARRCGGLPFEAFVCYLRFVRPLLRKEQEAKRMTARDVSALVAPLERALCAELGIDRLSPDIELVEYDGGVDVVSRRHFKANEVIFVEKKYNETFNEQILSVTREMTTTKIVAHFAEHLEKDQAQHSERWVRFTRQFKGAWPRTPDEIDAETRDTVGAYLRQRYPDMPQSDFDEFFMVLLMCRYNCFHAGFFRVCALANHSCKANIAMKYNSADETVTMIAVSDIQPGELMNVKYLNDAQFLVGLGKRRDYLRSWLFWCRCGRCLADNDEDAVQEHVCCPHCSHFTHHVVQPTADGADHDAADPLIRQNVPCRACGATLMWSDVQVAAYRRLLALELPDTTSPVTGQSSVLILFEWMKGHLTQVGKELPSHPVNWAYRVLFYFFCVGLTSFVTALTSPLDSAYGKIHLEDIKAFMSPLGVRKHYLPLLLKAKDMMESDKIDINRDELRILHDPVLLGDAVPAGDAPATTGGCEALRALLILAHLIAPFYPVYEMWAIHKAICEAVLVQLLFQDVVHASDRLSTEHALTLLERHGPYIGEETAIRWVHMFKLQSTALARGVKGLPPLNRLKKALKLK